MGYPFVRTSEQGRGIRRFDRQPMEQSPRHTRVARTAACSPSRQPGHPYRTTARLSNGRELSMARGGPVIASGSHQPMSSCFFGRDVRNPNPLSDEPNSAVEVHRPQVCEYRAGGFKDQNSELLVQLPHEGGRGRFVRFDMEMKQESLNAGRSMGPTPTRKTSPPGRRASARWSPGCTPCIEARTPRPCRPSPRSTSGSRRSIPPASSTSTRWTPGSTQGSSCRP